MHAYLSVVNQDISVWSSPCHGVERHSACIYPFLKTKNDILILKKKWGPKAVAEFSHQHKVSLTNIFMLVICIKSHYQYLYIQKITRFQQHTQKQAFSC